MTVPRVGVVHAPFGAANLRDISRAAVGLCQPVIIFTAQTAREHPDLARLASGLFEVAVGTGDRLDRVAAGLDLAGITTFSDPHLDQVDAIIASLGLPGMDGASSPWDKLVARQSLAERALTRARVTAVDRATDFTRALAEMPGPWVLKPRRGVSGSGVAFVNGQSDIDYQLAHRRHWRGLVLETRLPSARHPVRLPWLGDTISVETINTGDAHHHVAFFDKPPIAVVPRAGGDGADAVAVTGDLVPSRLPPEMLTAVSTLVNGALDALGVRWRVTHTEVRLTPYGPDIIEINGRTGGHLNRLLRMVGGVDLVAAALCLATGTRPGFPGRTNGGCAMGWYPSFPIRRGVVRSRVTAAELRALPGVVGVTELANHGRPRSDTGYRMVNLTLYGASPAEFDHLVASTIAGVDSLFAADLSG